jgi:DnaK suppressor protein
MDHHGARRSLEHDRELTLGRIASMTGELQAFAIASAGSNLDDEHDPEGATIAFERAQFTALLSRAQSHLDDIDAALLRLSGHGYGICQRCGNPIADERLAALPATSVCFSCAAG